MIPNTSNHRFCLRTSRAQHGIRWHQAAVRNLPEADVTRFGDAKSNSTLEVLQSFVIKQEAFCVKLSNVIRIQIALYSSCETLKFYP